MKAIRFIRGRLWLIFALLYLIIAVWPGSYWYKDGLIEIPDSFEGEPIELFYQGGAVRNFTGRYTVVSRNLATDEIACEAVSGFFPYSPDSKRPEPLYMSWWAPSDPRCNALPPGTYATQTVWTVSGILWGLVPPKHVYGQTITHTVRPRKE